MYSLTMLFYDRVDHWPGRLVRWLSGSQYTHCALQVGTSVAHVGWGDPPQWTTRRSYDKVEGPPALELSLGTIDLDQENLTNLFHYLHEACPQPVTIRSVMWEHYVLRRVPLCCTSTCVALLNFMNKQIPTDMAKPDTLAEYLKWRLYSLDSGSLPCR